MVEGRDTSMGGGAHREGDRRDAGVKGGPTHSQEPSDEGYQMGAQKN